MIFVNGKIKISWREGITITDLLLELNNTRPYLGAKITTNNKITRCSCREFDRIVISNNSEVWLYPFVAGG